MRLNEIINTTHRAYNKATKSFDNYDATIAKYATFSMVTFERGGKSLSVRLNKRPSKYNGNIIADAWNKVILNQLSIWQ